MIYNMRTIIAGVISLAVIGTAATLLITETTVPEVLWGVVGLVVGWWTPSPSKPSPSK